MMLLAASGWFINVATVAGAIVAVIGAGLALFRLPPLRWLWHRNVTGPIKEGLGRTITTVARPLIDEAAAATRAASKAQHDEQNVVLTVGFARVNDRLDAGSVIMTKHTDQIAALNAAIKAPRTDRTRDGDQ